MSNILGSSLLAKSSPGSKLREQAVQNAEKPALPGKGDVGTIGRAQVEEPLNRPVPQGSDKIVAAQPTVEGTTVAPTDIVPAGGVGLNENANTPLRSGAGNQALFQGGAAQPQAQPAGRVNPGGTTATQIATPTVSRAAAAYVPAPVEQVLGLNSSQGNQQVQGGTTSYQRDPFLSAVTTLGNKAYADTKNAVNKVISYTPTAGQYIAGAVGKAISNVPALRSLGNHLQSFGGSRAQGNIQGSIRQTVKNVSQNVGKTINNLRSQAGNGLNNLLRSLFGGRR